MTITVDGIEYRDHQWWLINAIRGFDKTVVRMAEVGVASGRTSEILLRECPDLHLWMVDRWQPAASLAAANPNRDAAWYNSAKQTAANRTEFAADRRFLFQADSALAASFPEIKVVDFDLVFIDAGHDYESVKRDVVAWWDRVYPGGLFCGHDIDSIKDIHGVWGVRKAVEEFASGLGLSFEVFKNIWFMRKPSAIK